MLWQTPDGVQTFGGEGKSNRSPVFSFTGRYSPDAVIYGPAVHKGAALCAFALAGAQTAILAIRCTEPMARMAVSAIGRDFPPEATAKSGNVFIG